MDRQERGDGHHMRVQRLTTAVYISTNRLVNSLTTPANPLSSRASTSRSMCFGAPP